MARRSRMSILKRQRELKKAEKAAQKRAKRHGIPLMEVPEPRATVAADAFAEEDEVEDDAGSDTATDTATDPETEPTPRSDRD